MCSGAKSNRRCIFDGYNEVVCNFTGDELGRAVDAIIKVRKQTHNNGNRERHSFFFSQKKADYIVLSCLTLNRTTFENDSIALDWYKGQLPLTELSFAWIPIRYIEPNAFDLMPLHSLVLLRIFNLVHVVDYKQPHILVGLRMVKELRIHEQPNPNAEYAMNFLWSMNLELKRFDHTGHILSHGSLTNLFGFTPLRVLVSEIDCSNAKGNTNFITARNFTALLIIKRLMINNCHLEHIAHGTFDAMSKTLLVLGLSGNRWLHLDLLVFRRFLDHIPTTWTMSESKTLIISDWLNSIGVECTDEFYRLQNMTALSLNRKNFWNFRCFTNSSLRPFGPINEHGYQFVHRDRWFAKPRTYKFPKFHIKLQISTQQLVVTPTILDWPYRVLLWRIMPLTRKPYCPRTINDERPIDCRYCQNGTTNIPISHIDDHFLLACVILVPSAWKQAIPFHCIAIMRRPAIDGTFPIEMILLIFAICMLSLMIWSLIFVSTRELHGKQKAQ